MRKNLLLLLAIALVVVSCSDSPTDPNVVVTHAKTGSVFTFEEYDTDSTSGAAIEETRDTSVHTIVSSGISFQGKTAVSKIAMVSRRDGDDTTYLNYESNGDISIFMPDSAGAGQWYALPISSKTANTITVFDGVVAFPIPGQMKVTIKSEHDGTSSMTVKGQSVSLIKIKQTTTIKVTPVLGPVVEDSNISYVFIAPSLGYMTKVEMLNMTTSGIKVEGSMSVLYDYDLK